MLRITARAAAIAADRTSAEPRPVSRPKTTARRAPSISPCESASSPATRLASAWYSRAASTMAIAPRGSACMTTDLSPE